MDFFIFNEFKDSLVNLKLSTDKKNASNGIILRYSFTVYFNRTRFKIS